MKKCKRLIAAASALMLSLCCLPLSAAAADVSPPVPEAVSAEARIIYERFDSVEDAGLYVRENLKKHTDELHILLTSKAKTDDILNDVLGVAFAETGRGDEGDYLRLSIEGYSSYTGYVLRDQVMDIVFHYNSTLEEEAALTAKEEEILASMALDEADEYEKISTVYDYLVKNVDYSEDYERSEVYTAYGALVENSAVCQGYIQAMYRMLTDMGVSCRAVMGQGNGGDHVWGIAGINGTYYLLDPTWDSEFDGEFKIFFLKGTADFDEMSLPVTHVAGSGDKRNSAFVPDCTSESFTSAYPISKYAFDAKAYYDTLIKGDLNFDGCIDIFDLISAKKVLLKENAPGNVRIAADVNGDNTVNISDAVLIQKFIEGSITNFSNAS
ncbi:MAG: hypothetical protein KBA55_11820 [Ruminococcus sp.]|nr:hypothetical protein [Ruminococcus sp.]